MAARAASTARLSRDARSWSRRLPLKSCRQVTAPMPTIASATAISRRVNPCVRERLMNVAGSLHRYRADPRIEVDEDAVRAALLEPIAAADQRHVGAGGGAVRVEEDLGHARRRLEGAPDLLDDGPVAEDPRPPARRLDRVGGLHDHELLRLAERDRLAATVVHGGRQLARGATDLTAVEAAFDHRHDQRAADGDDEQHHRHLDQSEAARHVVPPVLPSQLVMSRLSPYPPGAPSAP